ncbi:MAG: cysteine desulfurase family protein [Sandaracinaceae bacterium]
MIYLDHHAASPPDEAVCAVMADVRARAWGNPSSAHAWGRAARAALETAREQLAEAIGGKPADVVFTAGGTEACNLAVLGVAHGRRVILTTPIEHPAVQEAVAARGADVRHLAVPAGCPPSPDAFAAQLDGVELAVVQWVNHEVGTRFDIPAYAEACRARAVPLVVDATQALGKLPVNVQELGAAAVAFASSKVGGPLGAGALWIRRDTEIASLLHGGAQERGRRAGTPDVVALAGFGAAAACACSRVAQMPAVEARRDRLESCLLELGAEVAGATGPRVATVSTVSVPGWRGSSLVAALDLEGLGVSSGAACSSGVEKPNATLLAMYPAEAWRANAALRVSLSVTTTDDDVATAERVLRAVLPRKRAPRP